VSNASIKNHITTSISHIHSYNKPIIKTIHRAINITTTEAKLFTICCGINQAVANFNVNYIVIITNSLHTAKRIFDSSVHPYQIHSAAISQEPRDSFQRILVTISNFEIALANKSGHYIIQWTKTPKE